MFSRELTSSKDENIRSNLFVVLTDLYIALVFPSVPFRSVPFPSVPFRSLPFPSVPFRSLPFPSVPFRSLPFRSLPFRSLPFPSVPFPSLPSYSFTYEVNNEIEALLSCLRDTPFIRKQALLVISSLIKDDYIKWRGIIFYRITSAFNDELEDIRNMG